MRNRIVFIADTEDEKDGLGSPLVASTDPRIVKACLRAINHCVDDEEPDPPPPRKKKGAKQEPQQERPTIREPGTSNRPAIREPE